MKRRKKRKEAQRRSFSFKQRQSISQTEPTELKDVVSITSALKAAKFKLFSVSTISRRGTLSREQGLKRFISLSLKEDKLLIEKLAADYAKIFNTGLVVKSVGIETYYFTPHGKETHYFSSLRGIDKAPEMKTSAHDEDSVVKRMKTFYNSIEMNDQSAARHFVKTIKANLEPDLLTLFNMAIRST